jgi:peptidoglycan-N-acetylglucosamine deacetylase
MVGTAQSSSGGGMTRRVLPPVDFIHDGRKAIALTIDDGPSPVYTPQVLRLLAKYRITACFSMIGLEARTYPRVAREVADAGHVIVNHTWTHPDLALLSPALVIEQMDRATEAIHAATGRTPDLFRAPYGAWSPFILEHDGGGDRSETVAALKIVVPRLLAEGYHFRTP